jgi:hypothetical protein
MTYVFRGLEMHGRRMWERARIVQALDFIVGHDMNALVLHETDLIQQITFPRAYFDPYAEWKSAPTRRGENAIQNNRVYFDHILSLAEAKGVPVWIEVKELAFPDEVIEANPHLVKDGEICPSEPFWREFITAKTEELLTDFPRLAGMIVSPGSPEGRASRSQNKCRCALCAATPLVEWYCGIIDALHEPLKRHGKRLAIRDFAYKPKDHAPLIAAVDRSAKDVIFCIKTTPHDFYPTFPDNPALGRLRDREQWIEYDVEGQFYGWGVVPCFVMDDLRDRLERAAAIGVTGAVFRTEWERVNDWSCFDNLNILNLIAAAALSKGENCDPESICRHWLADAGWPIEAAAWLAGIMQQTWPIVRGAFFIDDFLFADCSMFPRSVGRAWWTMESKHSLSDWDPSRERDLDLDAGRMVELLAEKATALSRANELLTSLQRPAPGVPEALRAEIARAFEHLKPVIIGLALAAEVCLRSRWHQRDEGADVAAFDAAIAKLADFGAGLEPLTRDTSISHHIVMVLDHRRAADIVGEARRIRATAVRV